MRALLNRLLLTLGAAVAAVVLAASSAFAATWTVAGSSADGTITLTGTTTFTVHDGSGDQSITCQTVITVSMPNGTVPGPQIGSITGITFSDCVLGSFIQFNVQPGGLPWALNAESQSGGVVSGSITGTIIFQFSSSVGCSATATGSTLPINYDDGLFQLEIPGTGQDLTLSNVNAAGCQNLLHVGDPVSISGTYASDNAVTISES